MTTRDVFTFFHPMRVRWADCDAQGIVFYPEYMDDEIEVGVRCARLGRSSMTLAFGVFLSDRILTEGTNTYVHVDREAHTPEVLPEKLVETILTFEKVAPEQ